MKIGDYGGATGLSGACQGSMAHESTPVGGACWAIGPIEGHCWNVELYQWVEHSGRQGLMSSSEVQRHMELAGLQWLMNCNGRLESGGQ